MLYFLRLIYRMELFPVTIDHIEIDPVFCVE